MQDHPSSAGEFINEQSDRSGNLVNQAGEVSGGKFDKLKMKEIVLEFMGKGKNRTMSLKHQMMLFDYYMKDQAQSILWSHILLNVGRKKRDENNIMCFQTTAINMRNDKLKNDLLIECSLIDRQNTTEIEKVLRNTGIPMVDKEVLIFIQISHHYKEMTSN
jgi:hypothetical protein